ncbi:MAG: c-type cytochrome [Oligoflexia bacterium]|nr:c-type cytochrome [Oligoflexia bacterium]
MAHHGNHKEEHHHVTPLEIFHKVFIALIGLTVLTVVTSLYDFGMMNMVVAMAIASLKAALVIMFFMQLKYDNILNQLCMISAILFVAIFILITASDVIVRDNGRPMRIEKAAQGGDDPALMNKLRAVTDDQVAKGKVLYANNCASCHGATGGGDGPGAAALNPKPRNFLSGEWKYGSSPTRIFTTITNGVKGTGMSSYSGMSVEERYALVHYVRSISPQKSDDSAEDLKAAGLDGDFSKFKPKQMVDVGIVMENMAQVDQVELPQDRQKFSDHPGAKLYAQHCASCHGLSGQGAKVTAVGVNPPIALYTTSWNGLQAGWIQDSSAFKKIVSEGLTGWGKPGIGHFNSDEWSQLYSYARALSGR